MKTFILTEVSPKTADSNVLERIDIRKQKLCESCLCKSHRNISNATEVSIFVRHIPFREQHVLLHLYLLFYENQPEKAENNNKHCHKTRKEDFIVAVAAAVSTCTQQ